MFIGTNSTSFGYSNIILSELDLLELAGSVKFLNWLDND